MLNIKIKTSEGYDVKIGRGLLGQAGRLIKEVHQPCSVGLVSDDNVAETYMEQVAASLENEGFTVVKYVFPAGEQSKNMGQLESLLDFFARNEIGRSDLVAALGGGVTGDLAGFAAACFQRGISYVQLPTSLLAAVDSSVGGKTAVNLPSGKNLAGAFLQPKLVICDVDTFKTLPKEELSSGGAECVKYALLGEPSLLSLLTEQGLNAVWEDIIAPCVSYKGEVVMEDEKEQGLRKLLNLGHTVGHAAEKLSGYTIRHGEGVAMGMVVICRWAEKTGRCEKGVLDKLLASLKALNLPTICPYSVEELAKAALGDKKRQGDSITLVLPQKLGKCVLETVKTSQLRDIIQEGMEE